MADGHLTSSSISAPADRRVPLTYGTYGTYSVSYGVHQRGDGRWQVSEHEHELNRHGQKDTFTTRLSDWGTEGEALAALARVREAV